MRIARPIWKRRRPARSAACRISIASVLPAGTFVFALFLASLVQAEPVWKGITPRGIGRGQSVQFKVEGSDLKQTRLHVRDKELIVESLGDNTFQVTATKQARPGPHYVWLEAENVLLGPQRIHVDLAPHVRKTKPCDEAHSAMEVQPPCVVDGEFERAADVDWIQFHLDEPTLLTIAAQSVSLGADALLSMTLLDSKGREVAHSNDRCPEPVMHFAASPGDYQLRVVERAYGKSERSFYRIQFCTGAVIDSIFPPTSQVNADEPLRIYGYGLAADAGTAHSEMTPAELREQLNAVPLVGGAFVRWFAEPVEPSTVFGARDGIVLRETGQPNDQPGEAQLISPPARLFGQFQQRNDRDWYRFSAKKGESFTLRSYGERLGQVMDLEVGLHQVDGQLLQTLSDTPQPKGAPSDWDWSTLDASGEWKAPGDGEFLMVIRDLHGGSLFGPQRIYELQLERTRPQYVAACLLPGKSGPVGLWARAGSRVQVPLFIYRQQGFSQKIEVSAADLPAGVKWEDGLVGKDQTRGEGILEIGADAKPGFYTLSLVAQSAGRPQQFVILPVKVRSEGPPAYDQLAVVPLLIAEAPDADESSQSNTGQSNTSQSNTSQSNNGPSKP